MLGRLRMSIPDCIEAYKQMSGIVFKPKRRLNFLGRAKDAWKVQGAFDTTALESAIQKIIVDAGEDASAPLLEKEHHCKV